MSSEPFYDPAKSYLDNFKYDPFGHFADTTPTSQTSEPRDLFTKHHEPSGEVKRRAHEL
jgi:hypothetical protein